MKHNVEELYRVHHCSGKSILATLEFCNINDICFGRREAKEKGKKLFAINCSHIEGDKIKIYDTDDVFFGYVGSTQTWFDNEEERQEYKAQKRKEREEFLAWNKIKKEIISKLDEKTTKELLQILQSM